MLKQELRQKIFEQREHLSDQQIDKFNDLILVNFQKIPLSHIELVHTYISSSLLKEPATSLILRYLKFRFPTLRIAAPQINPSDLSMTHFLMDDSTTLKKNKYGIAEPQEGEIIEPEDIDLILVPLVGFDKLGHRAGYGKGYYDRFISRCRPDVIKAGLSFFEPIRQIRDVNNFDISLNYCCTPFELYAW